MQQKAPPIQWLPVFEAAARNLNFKKAAMELCVSPPAISQQIKVLEEYLGISLFDRSSRKLKLTAAGEYYYQTSRDIIKRHNTSYRDFERKFCHPTLQISSPIFIAQELLIPNYPRFKDYAPNIELRITTGNEYVDFDDEPADAALRFGTGDWPELGARFVSSVDIKLLCSQVYMEQHNLSTTQLMSKKDIEEQVIISLYEDLRDWRVSFPEFNPKQKIIVDSYFSAVRAAEEGLGIAIGLLPMVNQRIRDKKLIPLLTDTITTLYSYWLVAPKATAESENFEALYSWIKDLFETLE
jgi:LysR family glycine cleavage system transcriptional activator